MDPWLECPSHYPDLHNRLSNAISAILNKTLPAPFFTALSTRVYMEQSNRNLEPDVYILKPRDSWRESSPGGGVATMPALISEFVEMVDRPWPSDEITEMAVDIFTTDEENKLITSIELLSPANKVPGTTGRGFYMTKQYEMKAHGVNLIEIDLLRTGVHTTNVEPDVFRKTVGRYDYHISCWRADKANVSFGLPIQLTERLPVIRIPLIPNVTDATLDLQQAFDRAYDEAAFDRRVRYDRPCDPPLSAEQQAWAERVLKRKGGT